MLLPDNQQYHSMVGAILYVAVNTRPHVAASISILSRQIKLLTEVDWMELKLKLTASRDETVKLVGYCDTDWSRDPSDPKSNNFAEDERKSRRSKYISEEMVADMLTIRWEVRS